MNLKKLYSTVATACVLLLPQYGTADTLSLTVGGGIWNESASGNFQDTTDPAKVDVEDNLFWDTESQGYLFITFEHPVPILPNARLSYHNIEHSGNGNTSFVFDGTTYTGDIDNNINIEVLDLLLYYEILDNVVSVDIGLNARKLTADFDVSDNNQSDSTSSDLTIPMVYAMVGFSPLPDLLLSGEVYYISYDGSTISDVTAKIAYTTDFFVGVEAGYRHQTYELDDVDDTDADLTFSGAFVGAYLKF